MGELNEAADKYLAVNGATVENIAYIDQVIDRFQWFVDVALKRALEALATPDLPDNVVMLKPRRMLHEQQLPVDGA